MSDRHTVAVPSESTTFFCLFLVFKLSSQCDGKTSFLFCMVERSEAVPSKKEVKHLVGWRQSGMAAAFTVIYFYLKGFKGTLLWSKKRQRFSTGPDLPFHNLDDWGGNFFRAIRHCLYYLSLLDFLLDCQLFGFFCFEYY